MFYGLFMGTSVQYIKPANRYIFPTKLVELDPQFYIQLGGTSLLGFFKGSEQNLLINPGHSKAFSQFLSEGKLESSERIDHLVLTNLFIDNAHFLQSCEFEVGKVYYPSAKDFNLRKVFGGEFSEKMNFDEVAITEPLLLEIGDEEVEIIRTEDTYSQGDLYLVFPNRKLVFLGGLFYNQIHPVLRPESGMDVRKWICQLEDLHQNYPGYLFAPMEGEIASSEELKLFIDYLKALIDPDVEFSYCRKNFDWMEIPSHTSLEENFDLLRGVAKNFVSV
jgi:glyoxylase-like metal-dependent hydrolase (beta-lactamase superfamily II)